MVASYDVSIQWFPRDTKFRIENYDDWEYICLHEETHYISGDEL